MKWRQSKHYDIDIRGTEDKSSITPIGVSFHVTIV